MTTHRTVAAAEAGTAYLKHPGFIACNHRYFEDQDDKAASKNGLTYEESNTKVSVPSAGDSTLGFENMVTVISKGHSDTSYSEVQDVRVGRTNLSFIFTGVSPSLLTNNQTLVRSVVARVRAAEAAA